MHEWPGMIVMGCVLSCVCMFSSSSSYLRKIRNEVTFINTATVTFEHFLSNSSNRKLVSLCNMYVRSKIH